MLVIASLVSWLLLVSVAFGAARRSVLHAHSSPPGPPEAGHGSPPLLGQRDRPLRVPQLRCPAGDAPSLRTTTSPPRCLAFGARAGCTRNVRRLVRTTLNDSRSTARTTPLGALPRRCWRGTQGKATKTQRASCGVNCCPLGVSLTVALSAAPRCLQCVRLGAAMKWPWRPPVGTTTSHRCVSRLQRPGRSFGCGVVSWAPWAPSDRLQSPVRRRQPHPNPIAGGLVGSGAQEEPHVGDTRRGPESSRPSA